MKKKLKDFKKRLKKLKNSDTRINQKKNNNFQNIGMFLKSGVELISPVIVGVVIGLFCDHHFKTKPIFLIIFLIFGFAAGIINVYRSVKKLGFEVGFKKKNDKLH